jgi:glycerophosphoryl diester phosphodiesterase
LNVEIKRDVPDRPTAVWAVARLLNRRRDLHARLLISSFDPFMLTPLNVLLPLVPKALLFHKGQVHLHPWTVAKLGPWQAAHPEHVLIHGPLQMKRIVNTWTVNDPARARELAAFGVDGLITDAPAAILEALAPRQLGCPETRPTP